MSLILEALKKSEAKRRLGEAPDLATPFSAPRRRSPLLLIVIVLIAGVLVWWAFFSSPKSQPDTKAPATAQRSAPAPTPAKPSVGQTSGAPLRSVTGDNSMEAGAAPTNLPKASVPTEPSSAGMAVSTLPQRRRALTPEERDRRQAEQATVLEQRQAARAEAQKAREEAIAKEAQNPRPRRQMNSEVFANAAPAPAPAMKSAPTSSASAAKPATTPAAAAAAPARSATNAAATTASTPAAPRNGTAANPSQPAANSAASVATTTTATATAAPAPASNVAPPARAPKTPDMTGVAPPPTTSAPAAAANNVTPYSALPFGTRKSLPDMKISMHVYAKDPAQRFVILNDARLGEGDKAGDDLFVREIHPDGVVFEFQNQRFFYPRDGF